MGIGGLDGIGGIDGIDGLDGIGGIEGIEGIEGIGGIDGIEGLLGNGCFSWISTATASDSRNVFATEAACSKQHLITYSHLWERNVNIEQFFDT